MGAVLGVALITALIYVAYKVHRKKKNKQRLANIYSSDSQKELRADSEASASTETEQLQRSDSKTIEMDSFVVEKRQDMEANTAAGRFVVKF